MADELTIEAYLEHVGRNRNSAFGRRFRSQFRDSRGTAELAMLAAPTNEEYDDFSRAVAVMASREKEHPETLNDDAIADIAQRAQVDPGNVAIFINGFVLERTRPKKE